MIAAPTVAAILIAPGEAAVVRFHAELRRFIARRVSGPDADDVLQETLLRIHLGAGALRAQDALAPWVFRIARNSIADHHRKGFSDVGSAPDTEIVEDRDDAASGVREIFAACVEPFLGAIPPLQSEAVRLCELDGLTQIEAAAHAGVPLATMKSRVQRGRRALRLAFDACCDTLQDRRGAVVEATPRCGCA